LETDSTGIIFSIYIDVYTAFVPYSPSYSFLTSYLFPLVSDPSGRTCSTHLFSDFAKERKKK
jgi:hypothetical protein